MRDSTGIRYKKKFGQHFLRDSDVINAIISNVDITPQTSIFEIGCGDGVLTEEILATPAARLWVFEIDPEWARFVQESLGTDKRLTIYTENILDVDLSEKLAKYKPWTLLANLPYQITFPILYMLKRNRHLLTEGVVMVQEEVAQKIVKTKGRGYGFSSLFLQYFFDWKLLNKIPPSAFYPPPKVDSRLMYFKPKKEVTPIPDEEKFWKFIKICFKYPRRTLRNNLVQSHFPVDIISPEMLKLRAQQMSMDDLLKLWDVICSG